MKQAARGESGADRASGATRDRTEEMATAKRTFERTGPLSVDEHRAADAA
jgi:hypothetical protein